MEKIINLILNKEKAIAVIIILICIFLLLLLIGNITLSNNQKEMDNVLTEKVLCLEAVCIETKNNTKCTHFENLTTLIIISKNNNNTSDLILKASNKSCGL